MNGPVVVGVDDLEHSGRAMAAAAREALIRGVPLWLVHAYHWIPPYGGSAGGVSDADARSSAQALLDEAATIVRTGHPGLALETVPLAGPAPQSLAEVSPEASLLVVGARGRGGFNGLMLGSVAVRLLAHARSPVMIVRGDAARPESARVLVGVDVDDPVSGPEVLDFAFAEAALRKAEVYGVHAWEDNRYLYLTTGGEYVTEQFQASVRDRRHRVEALLAPWQDKHPDVAVSRQMFAGSPSLVLVDLTRLTDLLVLGGQLRPEGIRIGALAHTVLRHAHCPVVIVPEHAER